MLKHNMPSQSIANDLIKAAKELCIAVDWLEFKPPVTHVYNPLKYAWSAHEAYLRKFGNERKRVVFLGMNPGPFGMAQTGVPFGEVAAVRNWLKVVAPIAKPRSEHPKRPVDGFACTRSEISGRRLWGLFAERFGHAEEFFADHFVANYCPLAFFDERGRNLTPDKLPASEKPKLFDACDVHLRFVVGILQPEWLIGIGDFAENRAKRFLSDSHAKIGRILHPSPASPAANKNWARKVTEQLQKLGVWSR